MNRIAQALLLVAAAGMISTPARAENPQSTVTLMPGDTARIANHDWECGSTGSLKSGVVAGCSAPDSPGGPEVYWTEAQSLAIISVIPPILSRDFSTGRKYTYLFRFKRVAHAPASFSTGRTITVKPGQTFLIAGQPAWRCVSSASGARFTCTATGRPTVTLVSTDALYVGADKPVVASRSAVPRVRGYSWP